jgi:hypothetical protein
MNYMMLILEPHGQRATRTQAEGEAAYAAMLDYAQTLKSAGKLQAAESLINDDRGRRLQVRDGSRRTTDGPFTESKEMIGGYFLLTCESMEEACDIAANCPAAKFATIEVREFGPCFA